MSTTFEDILVKLSEDSDPSDEKKKSDWDKELYVLWASIPLLVKREYDKGNVKSLQRMGFPVDDTLFQRLAGCKTQGEFCKEFGVGINQPANWKKSDPALETNIKNLAVSENVLKYEREVDFSFTQKTIQSGDASRVKLWKQLYTGWTEKTHTEHSGVISLRELVESLDDDNESK